MRYARYRASCFPSTPASSSSSTRKQALPASFELPGLGELFLGEVTISERASLAGYVLNKKESLRLPDLRGKKGTRPLFHHDEPRLDARSAVCLPLTFKR